MSILFKSPYMQVSTANGPVYPNAKAEFFLTGTETPTPVYQDSALTTPHTNPVIADTKGLFPAIYLDESITYKMVLSDQDGGEIDSCDPYSTELGAGLVPISGLTPAADKFPYYTGSASAALADITLYGRGIVATSNESAFKQLVNLEIGTDVQAFNQYLADIAGITPAQGDVLYFDGTDWVALTAGTSGYFLQTNGADANPSWAELSPVIVDDGGISYFTNDGDDWTHSCASATNKIRACGAVVVELTSNGGSQPTNAKLTVSIRKDAVAIGAQNYDDYGVPGKYSIDFFVEAVCGTTDEADYDVYLTTTNGGSEDIAIVSSSAQAYLQEIKA